MAALFADGQMVACKPVGSIEEGEAYLRTLVDDLWRTVEADGRKAANDG